MEFNLRYRKNLFSSKLLTVFTKIALIRPVVEEIGSSALSKIKSGIRINLATSLKTGLFHGRNTYCLWGGRGKALLSQNNVQDFLETKFFCLTAWLHSTPNKCEDHFSAYFQRFCRVGGRMKAFLF